MIGIFLGEQNSGKTLSMSYFAQQYYKAGYAIYSNYSLKFNHKKISIEDIKTMVKEKTQFSKAVFLIDEIYLIFDSRNFSTAKNKIFSYFILQTSKRNVHLFGSAQMFNTVEKRLRENANFKAYCQRVLYDDKTKEYYDPDTQLRFIKDDRNLYIKLSFIIKKYMNDFTEGAELKTYFLKAKPIYNLYDTTELLDIE